MDRTSPRRLTPLGLLLIALAAVVALGGPRLTDDGLSNYRGAERAAAEEALRWAPHALDNPIERGLVQKLRVVEVRPPSADCGHAVRLRAYSFAWLPYATVTMQCGGLTVTRVVEP